MYQAEECAVTFTEAEQRIFRKREKITVSQWAERYRVVTMGPKKGPWSNSLTPYLVKPMDTWNLPWVQKIILCFAPQTGKTQVALNCLGYVIDQDPESAMYVMPDEKVAKRLSRRQIIPMLKATPRLADLLSPKADDTSTTSVQFQNGMDLMLIWASSAAALASESVRYMFYDETEKYPEVAGKELDPISLGDIRTTAFPFTKKMLYFSTPNNEGGVITRLKEEEADEIWEYHAQCPYCSYRQKMIFDQIVWPKNLRDPRRIVRKKIARYQCINCVMDWDDYTRNRAVSLGDWFCEKPVYRPPAVAFHLPSWYSPFVSLSEDAASFLIGQEDPAKLKIFVTQHKAEPWKQVIVKPTEAEILKAKCDLPAGTVPQDAIVLTAGIDVQKYGFWFVVRAWAMDYTSWLIHYGHLATWEDVENLLFETAYPVHESDAQPMKIWRAGMDTGGGKKYQNMSMTEETYWWIRKNGIGRGCRVFATKGASRPLAGKVHLGKALDRTPSGKPIPGGLQIISLDTVQIKDMVDYRLKQAIENNAYSAYLHKDVGQDYVNQILAEEKRKDDKGFETWVRIRKDNHLFDCECLAHIVADPEWPGGGINLINGYTSNRQPNRRKPKQKIGRW